MMDAACEAVQWRMITPTSWESLRSGFVSSFYFVGLDFGPASEKYESRCCRAVFVPLSYSGCNRAGGVLDLRYAVRLAFGIF